jgi:two-component system, OmpR family, sensor histidine kinase KdpD
MFLLGRLSAAVAAVAVITSAFQLIQVNPTTVALTYVVAVLLIATQWGITEATAASLTAMFAFNFFFLPPVGTLTIADPQNWVALVAFLITAIVASQLSGRAKERNVEAISRQRDLERLYALSRALLLLSDNSAPIPGAIARHIADVFELETVAVYDPHTDTVSWGGAKEAPAIEGRLRDVVRQATSFRDPSGLIVTAIQLGGVPIGSLAMTDAGLSDTVLQSIANLVAIGLERARGQEAANRAEAARQSGELRATLLDAVAHELKTPLTSMKAATCDLLASAPSVGREHELVAIIDEELDRLQTLVTDAIQMLRIDAGDFKVRRDRYRLADLVGSTLRALEARLDGHTVIRQIPDDLSIDVDRDLLDLALRQLLDNAVKYSPPTSTIRIAATGNGSVEISVLNSDSTISEKEQSRLFERFYRGTGAGHVPGTGMGLSIVQQIAQAHGGRLNLSSTPAEGTEFTMSFPRGDLHG